MRRLLPVLAAVSAVALSATAANAATNIGPCPAGDTACYATQPAGTSFIVTGNPYTGTDTVSASLGHTGIASGSFEDIYSFIIGPMTGPLAGTLIGSGSGSLDTNVPSGLVLEGTQDVDFTSVLVNGMAATITDAGTGGLFDFAFISGVPIYSGLTNTIDVIGTVGGTNGTQGSYGGSANFAPLAGVPEPATWAMMLLGFLGIGLVSRRRRKTPQLLQIA